MSCFPAVWPKIAILPNNSLFSSSFCSFRLSRSEYERNYDRSLIAYLSFSFIRFPRRILDIPLSLSLPLIYTSFYSSISRKSTALSARRASSIVLFQAAVESTFFLWSLGFYSVSCLQLAHSPSLSVPVSLPFPLHLSVSLNPSTILCRFSLSLLSQSAYPTFSHLLVISIDWSILGHCMLSRPFSIQFFIFRYSQPPDSLRCIILSSRCTLTT